MSEKEFIEWLIDALLDDDCTDGAVCELACRKLYKMGLIEKDGEFWRRSKERKDEN